MCRNCADECWEYLKKITVIYLQKKQTNFSLLFDYQTIFSFDCQTTLAFSSDSISLGMSLRHEYLKKKRVV